MSDYFHPTLEICIFLKNICLWNANHLSCDGLKRVKWFSLLNNKATLVQWLKWFKKKSPIFTTFFFYDPNVANFCILFKVGTQVCLFFSRSVIYCYNWCSVQAQTRILKFIFLMMITVLAVKQSIVFELKSLGETFGKVGSINFRIIPQE